ncbi:4-alpha-glucanotransferase [Pseudomonas aeruginosa]
MRDLRHRCPKACARNWHRRQVLGTLVLLFERRGERFVPPAQWPADAMATTSTHDLPSLSGWWRGQDIHYGAAAPDTAARRGMRGRPGTARRGAPGAGRQASNRRSIPTPPPKYRWTPASRLCRGNPRAVGATAPGGTPWAAWSSRTCPAPATPTRTGGGAGRKTPRRCFGTPQVDRRLRLLERSRRDAEEAAHD